MLKADLIAKAQSLGLQVTGEETTAELKELIAANSPVGEVEETINEATETVANSEVFNETATLENVDTEPSNIVDTSELPYRGFATLREFHKDLREKLGAGSIICPYTGKEVAKTFED